MHSFPLTNNFTVPPQILPFDFGEGPVNEGDTVSIQCTVSKGDNPLNITWTLNNRTVDESHGIIISHLKRVSILTIDSAQAEHAGRFTCLASNPAGSSTFFADLYINGGLKFAYVSVSSSTSNYPFRFR